MAGYYAYIIGDDDRIASRVDVICANDDEAKRLAKQLVDGHAVETMARGPHDRVV
jgi:hypothetical protein